MDFMLGIIIGLLIGGLAGALFVAACQTGKRADRYIDHSGYDNGDDISQRHRGF
jgi:hypothetical protein